MYVLAHFSILQPPILRNNKQLKKLKNSHFLQVLQNLCFEAKFRLSRVKQSGRVEIEKGTNVTEEARMRILNLKIPSNN